MLCEQLHIRQCVQPGHSCNQKIKPYFQGYVFGRVNLEVSVRSILDWIPGAIRIVNFGGEPVPVPDAIINILRQYRDTINAGDAEIAREFQAGDAVIIHGGPFAEYEGIFNTHLPGRNCVEVLLDMLQGSQICVELSIEQLTLQKP